MVTIHFIVDARWVANIIAVCQIVCHMLNRKPAYFWHTVGWHTVSYHCLTMNAANQMWQCIHCNRESSPFIHIVFMKLNERYVWVFTRINHISNNLDNFHCENTLFGLSRKIVVFCSLYQSENLGILSLKLMSILLNSRSWNRIKWNDFD